MADVDLEAVNKVREAMGLKPIPIPGAAPSFKESSKDEGEEEAASTLETREAAAGDNWTRMEKEREARRRRQVQKEAIRKARDAAQQNVKMTGKTLGEEDAEQDTATWLRQQARRRKEIEKKRRLEEDMAEREKALQPEYTAKDLAGVKVGHELNQFEAGDEQILTLKDAVIGEESEDDELENIDLRADEKLKRQLELKKKKPVYNPNDDDESGEKSILRHYDEEIIGEQRQRFTLDGQGSTREKSLKDAEDATKSSKGLIISLDILKDNKPVSDYVDISEIKIKRPKKKKSKSTRTKNTDDDDIFINESGDMDIDLPAAPRINSKKRTYDNVNFVDDDDLQSKLSQQRLQAFKNKKRIRPEDIARELKDDAENAMDIEDDQSGLVLDETSEFLSHLQQKSLEDQNTETTTKKAPPKSDAEMEEPQSPEEDESEFHIPASVEPHALTTGLEEESSMDQGIGATLAMLRQRRLVEDGASDDLSNNFRQHESFIAEKRARQEDAERDAKLQRERDRQSGRLDRMSARDREEYARANNTRREQMESRAVANLFNEAYKPNVELKYIDEFGRSMNQKEAFKHLSHQFHGKGSGKQKHEKRLKKIDEEKKREAMSTLDSSQHASSSAMGSKAKKNQQAGVRLQ